MLRGSVSGSLPKLADLKDIMSKLAQMMDTDVRQIVSNGSGWRERVFPGGRAVLGYIHRNLKQSSGDDFAQVEWNSSPHSPKAAFAHEFGATIQISDRMRGFFYHKFKETGQRFWLGMYLHRGSTITIPKRSVIEEMRRNVEKYVEFVGRNLTITTTEPI
jgi:hypothetical protein